MLHKNLFEWPNSISKFAELPARILQYDNFYIFEHWEEFRVDIERFIMANFSHVRFFHGTRLPKQIINVIKHEGLKELSRDTVNALIDIIDPRLKARINEETSTAELWERLYNPSNNRGICAFYSRAQFFLSANNRWVLEYGPECLQEFWRKHKVNFAIKSEPYIIHLEVPIQDLRANTDVFSKFGYFGDAFIRFIASKNKSFPSQDNYSLEGETICLGAKVPSEQIFSIEEIALAS